MSEEARERWIQTWNEFKTSITDITSEFHQFYWIHRLFRDGCAYAIELLYLARFTKLLSRQRCLLEKLIPCFVIALVLSIMLVYRRILHDAIIVEQVCSSDDDCTWSRIHWVFAHYLVIMILSNFIRTSVTSPGIVIPAEMFAQNQGRKYNRLLERFWILVGRQIDIEAERYRGALYVSGQSNLWHPPDGQVYIPSPNQSFCKKCKLYRPARSHHCSKLDVCVLQVCQFPIAKLLIGCISPTSSFVIDNRWTTTVYGSIIA